jgi:hypothetical protein
MAYKKKDKSTNNDLPNTTQKTKDRATRTPLKTGVNSRALKRDQYFKVMKPISQQEDNSQ